ncbi:hypothetical protein CR513_26753, partial [Mucuna pruriens]
MSLDWIVFDKACHLPAIKQGNMVFDQADKERKLQLQELEELFLEAYENSWIYKQKIKKFHDRQILRKDSLQDGPFVITHVFPHGAVELKDEATNSTFQVNGHQLKIFHEGPMQIVGEEPTI